MIAHRDEIYSRPKRTWFVTEKEKKLVQKAAKVIFHFVGHLGCIDVLYNGMKSCSVTYDACSFC